MTTESVSFAPFQQAFIDQLLTEVGPASTHVLIAPTGAGKSFAIAGGIAALVEGGRVSRVLVLSRDPLLTQWTHVLERCGVEAIMLDGRSIRVMRNEYPHGLRWPEGVFTMSIDLARRDDVCELVTAQPWDFVVIDEAHALTGQCLQLVQAILSRSDPPGILFASPFVQDELCGLSGDAIKVDWHETVEQLRAAQMSNNSQANGLETRSYCRTPEEVVWAAEVMEFARRLEPIKEMHFLCLAASSVLALEETLYRQLGAGPEDSDDLEALERLMDSIDGLPVDSKLECLKSLVDELVQSGIRHVVLFCDYKATLNYLCAVLQPLEFADFQIHEGMPAHDRAHTFSRFQNEGGILVTTTAASRGLSMSFVEAVVHYDLPSSQMAFAQRVGGYRSFGRTVPCRVYCLEDENGSMPIEAVQLQMVRSTALW